MRTLEVYIVILGFEHKLALCVYDSPRTPLLNKGVAEGEFACLLKFWGYKECVSSTTLCTPIAIEPLLIVEFGS